MMIVMLNVELTSCDKDEYLEPREDEIKINNNGQEYADLGLSAYWATYNIGAYSSTSQGNKYAFGEMSTKSEYKSTNYFGGNTDVVKQNWGGDWRLPTRTELEELVKKCTWRKRTIGSVQVITATGPNGNSIDLPYSHYLSDGSGLAGWYWSSTSSSTSRAYCLYFENGSIGVGTNDKYYGFLVRGVITNPNYKDSGENSGHNPSGEVDNSSYEKPVIGFDSFSATKTSLTVKFRIYNKDKAGITSSTIYYGRTSNPSQSVSTSILGVFVTATISGLSKGTEYWVKCKVTGKGGTTTSDVAKCITNY